MDIRNIFFKFRSYTPIPIALAIIYNSQPIIPFNILGILLIAIGEIIRINAAAKLNDISYSKLIYGMTLAGIDIDRKTLSDLALNEPDAFREIVSLAKDSLR